MLLAVAIALLAAVLAGSFVIIVQGMLSRGPRASESQEAIRAFAERAGGLVTVEDAARTLGISRREAERILRGLVDDESVALGIDDRRGILLFWYPKYVKHPAGDDAGVYIWSRSPSVGGKAPPPKAPRSIPPAVTSSGGPR
ncbi:MAG: hypothetical protein U1E65_25190 [Myxococcota bacterium]